MTIKKFSIYLVNLDPRFGTEPGKIRPAVVVQTDLLNGIHPSTIVCPITTNVIPEANLLRVHLDRTNTNLKKLSDILVDQIRAIDNQRIIKCIGKLNTQQKQQLMENLRIILQE